VDIFLEPFYRSILILLWTLFYSWIWLVILFHATKLLITWKSRLEGDALGSNWQIKLAATDASRWRRFLFLSLSMTSFLDHNTRFFQMLLGCLIIKIKLSFTQELLGLKFVKGDALIFRSFPRHRALYSILRLKNLEWFYEHLVIWHTSWPLHATSLLYILGGIFFHGIEFMSILEGLL
jgi:hypothetical protein